MKQKDLNKINVYLEKWRGANAFLNTYVDDNDRLIIGFVRPDNALEFVGVCFLHCVFLSGPTRWKNCDLRCQFFELSDGEIGLEIRDAENGFLLRCAGPVVVGDGEFVIPQN